MGYRLLIGLSFFNLHLVTGIDAACAGRPFSTDEFFLDGRHFGASAVSLSVRGSGLSETTFLNVPGFVLVTNWSLLISGVSAILALMIVERVFVSTS